VATDYANLIPSNVAAELIRGTIEQSAVLRLARTIRMAAGQTSIPVVSAMPEAGFVAARGGRKPSTVVEWSSEQISPEELACVIAVPDDWVADASFPVWAEIRPLLEQALGMAFDDAVLWGIGAPASFPTGGVEAVAGAPITGPTALDAINGAMSQVELSGLLPTGHVIGPRARPTLRMLRDENGNLVYAQAITQGEPDRLFGLPLTTTAAFDAGTAAELLTGDWSKLVVGIRSDVSFELSDSGVLTDGDGLVTVSAFEQDMTLMRCHMRAGAAIGIPVNRNGDPTEPFALAEFTPPPGVTAVERSRERATTRRKVAEKRAAARAKEAEAEAARSSKVEAARARKGGD
jgi:HK97 family phage major capsid protein